MSRGRVVLRPEPLELRRPQVRVIQPPPPIGCELLHQPPLPLRVCQRHVARVAFRRIVRRTLSGWTVLAEPMVGGQHRRVRPRPDALQTIAILPLPAFHLRGRSDRFPARGARPPTRNGLPAELAHGITPLSGASARMRSSRRPTSRSRSSDRPETNCSSEIRQSAESGSAP